MASSKSRSSPIISSSSVISNAGNSDSAESSSVMVNSVGGIRRKNVEDGVESLEKGDRYDEETTNSSTLLLDEKSESQSEEPLTLRDKKALTLLVALCKL
jgi:hypothetical protein